MFIYHYLPWLDGPVNSWNVHIKGPYVKQQKQIHLLTDWYNYHPIPTTSLYKEMMSQTQSELSTDKQKQINTP